VRTLTAKLPTDLPPDALQDRVSHYEPRNGHCYVELSVRTADITQWNVRYLYDGQTKELLAVSGYENGKLFSNVFGSGRHLGESTDDYINKMMLDKDR
jgi:hypothetical protein